MGKREKMTVCFMGGRQAGIIASLSILSAGWGIKSAVSYSDELTNILELLYIPAYNTINNPDFETALSDTDLILSVHGREIVDNKMLEKPRLGAVNIHPYLYKYKGANPVSRALEEKNFKASVGAHVMDEKVDVGRVLMEEFVDVSGSKSVEEIYSKLYPTYCKITIKVLQTIINEKTGFR